ncbi:uncharacterized protein LOC123532875 isoform X2 [Mercenaria mercenaria]|uniref:uncharacterized protein LOC123532875 isoform X2 n=1 Tax=Mercenaria mercenaria TaxID=6596 RepID=UPI00234E60BC|nr:uncharacterized protein LOC123532875 isoform X2 [Mercenaria mercenaria]
MESLYQSSDYVFGWNKIVESVTGWDPVKAFLPAIPAATVVYMSVYLIGLLLHTITRMIVPTAVRGYILDFVKTMTFCAYPFGHGIMRKYYGEPGYMCAMVPTMFLSFMTLREGDGNPIAVWLQYYKRIIPLWKCIIKTIIQIIAGFAAYHVGMYILGLELHPMYVARLKEYYDAFCSSDLTVPAYVGFCIEFCAVIYDCWFANQTFTGNLPIDTLIKIFNSGLLVVSGVHLTGMYIHPAMATGHTWGCGDTSGIAHIIIYWVGPIIGTWISFHLQKRFSLRRRSTKASRSRSSGNSQSNKKHVNGTTPVNGTTQVNEQVSAHRTGANPMACDTMKPGHGANRRRTSATPYIIDTNLNGYVPCTQNGQRDCGVIVRIRGRRGRMNAQFKGFLLQARTKTPDGQLRYVGEYRYMNGQQVVGRTNPNVMQGQFAAGRAGPIALGQVGPPPGFNPNFNPNNPFMGNQVNQINNNVIVQRMQCNRGTGVTHTENSIKNVVQLQWIPPVGYNRPVQFVATVVRDYNTFWMGHRSRAINARPALRLINGGVANTARWYNSAAKASSGFVLLMTSLCTLLFFLF